MSVGVGGVEEPKAGRTLVTLEKAAHWRCQVPVPSNQHGYSLFEMIIVMVIIGILASITMRSLRTANDVARTEETRTELDRLAWAIAGNPEIVSGGRRTDYGYVGDVGVLPPNLEALAVNPGLGTWGGPYMRDEFRAAVGGDDNAYTVDAWGQAYSYAGSVITSTGGGSALTRQVAKSSDDLLRNSVTVVITDLAMTPPGMDYRDSVRLLLTVPDGAGSYATKARLPRPDGLAQFDSIPIGSHLLQMVYLPNADTLRRRVAVDPGRHVHVDLQYPEEVW